MNSLIELVYGLGTRGSAENLYSVPHLNEIERNGIAPQLYFLLKSSGHILDVPDYYRERLRRRYENSFLQNLLVKQETERLLRHFDASGISVIPLKGTVMAERYYGHFAARGTSDIDLLIKPGQVEEAARCVRQCGYSRQTVGSPVHYHSEWHKNVRDQAEPLTVELHWSFVQQDSASLDIEAAWEESMPMPGYEHVRLLTAEYTFYSLCLHGASHRMDNGKYTLDLVHLLCRHGGCIELDRVIERASRDRTLRRVAASLAVVYRLFPELRSNRKLPQLPLCRFWSNRYMPGVAMERQVSGLLSLLCTLSLLDEWKYRAAHLIRLMFPSRELAAYSVNADCSSMSAPQIYIRLYGQRLRKLFGG